jgi:hypothetical protein
MPRKQRPNAWHDSIYSRLFCGEWFKVAHHADFTGVSRGPEHEVRKAVADQSRKALEMLREAGLTPP